MPLCRRWCLLEQLIGQPLTWQMHSFLSQTERRIRSSGHSQGMNKTIHLQLPRMVQRLLPFVIR